MVVFLKIRKYIFDFMSLLTEILRSVLYIYNVCLQISVNMQNVTSTVFIEIILQRVLQRFPL